MRSVHDAGPDRAAQRVLYQRGFAGFGEVQIRRFDLATDVEFLCDWVNRDYAYFWGLQGTSLDGVRSEYEGLLGRAAYDVLVGLVDGRPSFLLERYDPRHDELARFYSWNKGDCGVHFMVAPPLRVPRRNFTWFCYRTALDFVFSDARVQRVLVEPDIRNRKMFAICQRVGFRLGPVVDLPHKTAQLAFLSRDTHERTSLSNVVRKRSAMNHVDTPASPGLSVAHVNRDRWNRANRALVCKAIREFAHERLLVPRAIDTHADGWDLYELKNETAHYSFRARKLPLEHWWVDAESIRKHETRAEDGRAGNNASLDASLFIKEFRGDLGISPGSLPVYLEEILSTLHGAMYKMAKGNRTASQLVHADFQTIEQTMTEGHPGFVANNGRIGFDSGDYRAFAPEAGNSFPVLWLAGHKSKTVYAGTDDLPYDVLIAEELDEQTRTAFKETLTQQGVAPDDYYFFPVHPWQWFNKLSTVFASEIASQHLCCLGYGPDQYLAQQSIRTLYNVSNPHKRYAKSALSILNMGFMRGLPLYYLGTAPRVAAWLEEKLYSDPFIEETGFRMLSETASVSYVNPYFEEFGPHNDYNKMLATLWRESPSTVVPNGQTALTMAALLHVDDAGDAFLPELIQASGLSTTEWLGRYLRAYLTPLLHCFYGHDLVFMPHGENVILVMNEHVPVRSLMKDITEEAAILSPDVRLPDELSRMYVEVPEEMKTLSIFIDIFDGFFRFAAQILEEHASFPAVRFWRSVADCVRAYQARFPELRDKFDRYDLFAPRFTLSCLNRLQLRNNRQMIDLDEPVAKLQFAGDIDNPLAPHK